MTGQKLTTSEALEERLHKLYLRWSYKGFLIKRTGAPTQGHICKGIDHLFALNEVAVVQWGAFDHIRR